MTSDDFNNFPDLKPLVSGPGFGVIKRVWDLKRIGVSKIVRIGARPGSCCEEKNHPNHRYLKIRHGIDHEYIKVHNYIVLEAAPTATEISQLMVFIQYHEVPQLAVQTTLWPWTEWPRFKLVECAPTSETKWAQVSDRFKIESIAVLAPDLTPDSEAYCVIDHV